ncbi:uncharacterized protein EI97DRAFT_465993 [Westerdykella ornata]|uniref:Protein kinase domain-containing protein n=1 Tax=Westerdykella ornata TaxID=318751 RepID=A0A6A6JMX8_WESOR|nr:uncharacterized protein EI97DRAFT_465993 [Westerdykella ornata]KAF2277877.1 hypothetical protein EI97DRAFT_465993 [Westerdykella ornata]
MDAVEAHSAELQGDAHIAPSDDRKKCSFEGRIITCEDGSSWKIAAPVSSPRYQRVNSPCEATQVYTCICVEDPTGNHDGLEAVVKVKYQIRGSRPSIVEYEHLVEENLELARYWLHATTNPVEIPNQSGINEVRALRYLSQKNCPYTPHYLGYSCLTLEEGVDHEGIVGGYAFFIIMTKVPGQPLLSVFLNLSASEREEVRQAFKEAITEFHALGMVHRDAGMRNLLWDRESRKCYIIDFEEHEIYRTPYITEFGDYLYERWELSDSQYSSFSRETSTES